MNTFNLIGVFALGLGISNVFADSIKLKNEDQLRGKVTAQSDKFVVFSHDVLGTLFILRADIIELKTDEQPVAEKPEDNGLIDSGFLVAPPFWIAFFRRYVNLFPRSQYLPVFPDMTFIWGNKLNTTMTVLFVVPAYKDMDPFPGHLMQLCR